MKSNKQQSPDLPSRRRFLLTAGATLGTLALSRAAQATLPEHSQQSNNEEAAPAFKFGNEPVRQRKSFYDITDEELRNLCRAIGYMRNGSPEKPVSVDNPLQWDRYVASHAHHCTEAGFEQVHWSWFFFPWHRAYLFFVERVLADILTKVFNVDGSKFALPYWDWTSHHELPNTRDRAARGIASPFFGYDLSPGLEDMVAADKLGFDNLALWDGYRGPSLQKPEMTPNNEASESSKDHIAETLMFVSPQYINLALRLGFEDFAGKSTIDQDTGQGVVEHDPHNNIHDWVGSRYGKNRDMGTLRYAALDPLFLLHHANIDRIWSLYKKPQPDPDTSDWGKQKYTFIDATGSSVSVSVRDIVKSITNVQYVGPQTPEGLNKTFQFQPFAQFQPLLSSSQPAKEKVEVLSQEAQQLTAKPLTVEVPAKPSVKSLLDLSTKNAANSVNLLQVITGPIRFSSKFSVRIFVNKADADRQTPITDPHYVGRLRGLDSDARLAESDQARHSFLVLLAGIDNTLTRVLQSGEPFKLTFVPVISDADSKDFGLTVQSVKVKIVE